MSDTIYEHINEYNRKGVYPFHMPGHKRNRECLPQDLLSFDVTEIPGMDNLHDSKGIIREAQKRVSQIYNSDESFFVVNGSTAAIIASICAVSREGERVLAARNCHLSVFSGLVFSGAEPVYITPDITQYGIAGGINPAHIRRALEEDDSITAVVITSPTYEGIVSDVEAIAKIVHEKNKILIVDEAHGSHFVFSDYFPKSSIELGADIVIQSMHKTLPALTQTALIHIKGVRAPVDKIKNMLSMLQTSSPSYVFLACADYCLERISHNPKIFSDYVKMLDNKRQCFNNSGSIRLIGRELVGQSHIFDIDPGKLVFTLDSDEINGKWLERQLFDKYKVQIEMSSIKYIIAMTSPADTLDGFNRLFSALSELSSVVRAKEPPSQTVCLFNNPKVVLMPRESMNRPFELVPLDKSRGRISASFVIPYPPGIPIVAPGEEISEEIITVIKYCVENKMLTLGYNDVENGSIKAIRETKSCRAMDGI